MNPLNKSTTLLLSPFHSTSHPLKLPFFPFPRFLASSYLKNRFQLLWLPAFLLQPLAWHANRDWSTWPIKWQKLAMPSIIKCSPIWSSLAEEWRLTDILENEKHSVKCLLHSLSRGISSLSADKGRIYHCWSSPAIARCFCLALVLPDQSEQ